MSIFIYLCLYFLSFTINYSIELFFIIRICSITIYFLWEYIIIELMINNRIKIIQMLIKIWIKSSIDQIYWIYSYCSGRRRKDIFIYIFKTEESLYAFSKSFLNNLEYSVNIIKWLGFAILSIKILIISSLVNYWSFE